MTEAPTDSAQPGARASFPWDNLETAARYHYRKPLHTGRTCRCHALRNGGRILGYCWTLAELGETLDINPATVRTWKKRGRVPAAQADKIACALGWYANVVFPGWEEWIDGRQ